MRATDVMLVFLMLTLWGQNYQVLRDVNYLKTRAARAVMCRQLPPRGQQ